MCNGAKIQGIFEDSKFLVKKAVHSVVFLLIYYNNMRNMVFLLREKQLSHPEKNSNGLKIPLLFSVLCLWQSVIRRFRHRSRPR